jgi:CheY-like chemotaxis protein
LRASHRGRLRTAARADIEDALRLCRRHLPDLLVVDLDLPGDGGPELLRRIREAHWLKA